MTHNPPEITVTFPRGDDPLRPTGNVFRSELIAMTDDEILADLSNPAGWDDGSTEARIAEGIYAVSTGWRDGPKWTVLKCRGMHGDFLFRIVNDTEEG